MTVARVLQLDWVSLLQEYWYVPLILIACIASGVLINWHRPRSVRSFPRPMLEAAFQFDKQTLRRYYLIGFISKARVEKQLRLTAMQIRDQLSRKI